MNSKTLIKKCLLDDDAIETRPWKDEYENFVVIRHKSNNKWFALIFNLNDELCINLKIQPEIIPILKEQYPAIKPAWHMNKKHWCTIEVNNIEQNVLRELINISFNLTAPRKKVK